MREHGSLTKDAETNQAAWEAAKGAVAGGAKWGLVFLGASLAAYKYSPLYRGLTIQFKTYIQMSAMVFGGMLEADSRLQAYQLRMRREKKLAHDIMVWRQFEADFEAEAEGAVSRGKDGEGEGKRGVGE